MSSLTNRFRKWVIIPVAALAIGAGLGAGGAQLARQYFVTGPSATQVFIFPGGDLNNDSDVAMLDTRTGAVYRYRGQLDNPSARGTWEQRVAPPKEAHSGMLEIQRLVFPSAKGNQVETEAATFLVDIVTGTTWVLHLRASTNGSWDIIKHFDINT